MRVATRVQSKLSRPNASCHSRPIPAEQTHYELPLALSKINASCHSRPIQTDQTQCALPLASLLMRDQRLRVGQDEAVPRFPELKDVGRIRYRNFRFPVYQCRPRSGRWCEERCSFNLVVRIERCPATLSKFSRGDLRSRFLKLLDACFECFVDEVGVARCFIVTYLRNVLYGHDTLGDQPFLDWFRQFGLGHEVHPAGFEGGGHSFQLHLHFRR